jgi:hypothetical protein
MNNYELINSVVGDQPDQISKHTLVGNLPKVYPTWEEYYYETQTSDGDTMIIKTKGDKVSIKVIVLSAQSADITEKEGKEVVKQGLTTIVTDQKFEEAQKDTSGVVHFYRQVNPVQTPTGVEKLLSRKYRVATLNWDSTQAPGTLLYSANFPYALLQVSDNLVEKINRFHYMRANVRLGFSVTGTLYHYGTAIAAIQPFTKGESTNPRMGDIYRMSTMDNVLISTNTKVPVEIVIPFMGQVSHWEHTLSNNEGYFGSVVVRVFHALAVQNATTTNTVTLTVWANFENIELMGPTLHAQSGEQLLAQSGECLSPLFAQSGVSTDLDALQVQTNTEQIAKSKSGIVSKGLEFASRLASACVLIPGVGSVASLAAAGLFFASKGARYFGFDKPDNVSKFQPVYLTTTNSLALANGMNTSNSLCMDVENQISTRDEDFCAKTCETDFGHLVSLPGLFYQGSITGSDVAGTVIYKWHNTPSLAPAQAQLIQYLPCSLIASQFAFWRGQMKYLIRFDCSAVHNLWVRISYHPTYDEIVLSPEGEGDFYSQAFPVTGVTTIPFSIPYLSNKPYKRTRVPNAEWQDNEYAGAIALSIVNPVCEVEGSVNTTIYFSVWAAAESNMEFHEFCEADMGIPGVNMLVQDQPVTFGPPFVAQSGESACTFDLFKGDFPMLFQCNQSQLKRVCFGEETKSVLDLCHRFQKVDQIILGSGTTQNWRYPPRFTDAGLPTSLPFWYTINVFDEWFLFARRSYQLKVFTQANTDAGAMADGTLYARNQFDLDWKAPVNLTYGREGTVMENFHYKPSLEIRVGQYGPYPYIPRGQDYPTEFRGIPEGGYNGVTFNYDSVGDTTDFHGHLFFALSDDASFGYPRGCPKVAFFVPEESSRKPSSKLETDKVVDINNNSVVPDPRAIRKSKRSEK